MDAELLVAFLAGAALGAFGLGLGFWVRLRLGDPLDRPLDRAKITFHRPREGVLVVEVRQDLSATYAASLREWLERVEGEGAEVLVVALGDRL